MFQVEKKIPLQKRMHALKKIKQLGGQLLHILLLLCSIIVLGILCLLFVRCLGSFVVRHFSASSFSLIVSACGARILFHRVSSIVGF